MSDGMDYYSNLPARLLEYIVDETKDSLYYKKLAGEVKNKCSRELFLEFSRDEAQHAANFRQVYRQITGVEAPIGPVNPPEIPNYCEAIKQRIMAESNDFVKYSQEAMNTPVMELHHLFHMTGVMEAKHGLRLTTLLCGVEHRR
jgi:rubrerythrin